MVNRIFFISIYIAVFCCFCFGQSIDMHTTLVLIEETENGKKITREPGLNQPFADGLYEALWDYEGIFFDSVPSTKFGFEEDGRTISAIPFIREATGCGADTILLIKVNYSTSLAYSKLTIVLDDLRYALYSIYEDKNISCGDLSGKFQNTTERVKQQTYLKGLGRKVLRIIYGDAELD